MEFRSTNDNGWVHFQGDLVSNVSSGQGINSSHGVQLTGGSTGGIVQSAGDETNIAVNVRGKGTGRVQLGTTSAFVVMNTTGVQIGEKSTSFIARVQQYTIQWTPAALSSGPAFSESTITVTGLTTNAVLDFTARSVLSGAYSFMVRCSTAAELKFSESNQSASTIGSGESTARGILLETTF